ncbi:hypothetical protein HALDL1_04030 [Halobacterium sp. DL1]|nr:hypothetical protein HALDL1_04030 [Halobacterium sp. DL1]
MLASQREATHQRDRTRARSSRLAWAISFCGALVAVAAGYALVGVPVVSEVAGVPFPFAGAAVVLSVQDVSTWLRVAALAGLACGLAGFLAVTYTAVEDWP